jgi:hypothetical protein
MSQKETYPNFTQPLFLFFPGIVEKMMNRLEEHADKPAMSAIDAFGPALWKAFFT